MIPWETGSSEKQVNLDFPTSVQIVAWPGRINTHPVPLLSFKRKKKNLSKNKSLLQKRCCWDFGERVRRAGVTRVGSDASSYGSASGDLVCYSDSGAEAKTALNCNLRPLVLKTDLPMKLPLRSTNLNQLPFEARSPANLTVSYRTQLSAFIARA